MAYSPDIGLQILVRIADGESLRKICLDKGMPTKTTVFRWLAEDEGFRDQYARAREAQADALFDDVLAIADETTDPEQVQIARMRIDARKWMAGKLRPKKYGEKLELSGDKDSPLTVQLVRFADT